MNVAVLPSRFAAIALSYLLLILLASYARSVNKNSDPKLIGMSLQVLDLAVSPSARFAFVSFSEGAKMHHMLFDWQRQDVRPLSLAQGASIAMIQFEDDRSFVAVAGERAIVRCNLQQEDCKILFTAEEPILFPFFCGNRICFSGGGFNKNTRNPQPDRYLFAFDLTTDTVIRLLPRLSAYQIGRGTSLSNGNILLDLVGIKADGHALGASTFKSKIYRLPVSVLDADIIPDLAGFRIETGDNAIEYGRISRDEKFLSYVNFGSDKRTWTVFNLENKYSLLKFDSSGSDLSVLAGDGKNLLIADIRQNKLAVIKKNLADGGERTLLWPDHHAEPIKFRSARL